MVHQNVLYFSKFLGCNFQYFNKNEKITIIDNLPIEKYDKYKFDFQTWPETQNKNTVDIFIDFLKNSN